MVYTKHFNIHYMNKLHQSKDYVENAKKTTVRERETHFHNLFPYVTNLDKTISMQLVSGHLIHDVYQASDEFLKTKELHARMKGTDLVYNPKTNEMEFERSALEKTTGKGKAVLAHHLIQSFSPEDNLTPEQIHEIGRKTMLEFTGGEYEFVIATHVDKEHIHNHIVMNSTNSKTGKAFPWKVVKKKNKEYLDFSKYQFEKVSDKISRKAGAKIIQKNPKNSHLKYTKWQTESIFKSKIKQRLDFLLSHSHDVKDFLEKAEALNLHCDFSGKWAKFLLLDEPQIKNTRSRQLDKRKGISAEECRYNLPAIQKQFLENTVHFSVEDVVNQYEEKVNAAKNDFDYQVQIEPWQVDYTTEKGIHLNVDFGVERHGQIFIGAYKVDKLENGNYLLYLKKDDRFYFMDEKNAGESKNMDGYTLMKQLSLYNGTVPLKKEPVISTMNDLVSALNFLASHDVTDGTQLQNLEKKLLASFEEAEGKLKELDSKILEYTQVTKLLLMSEISEVEQEELNTFKENLRLPEDVTQNQLFEELKQAKVSREILKEAVKETAAAVNAFHDIEAGVKKLEKDDRQRLG
ncbi:Relaxase/Mobilisation nuclease domain-containing protein [Pilibacter termitis]|uniref:Relaxase/Mobilisation nuclease domain-containing protein n=1 Tax=Pilibacter termitis TaxID=263852 RepID=A0A1T4KTU6_9ENTE|nr:relaxase/mobilization nuclease domain-containing protein [Pilibacter termitis]SJZ45727.1 Relaxase/Mobilisation nuclease domain-containing protein [Pilibacter termitis]